MSTPTVNIVLLPKSQTNQRPGIKMYPVYGTTHETGNLKAGANARMHLRFLQAGSPDQYGNPTQTSYHFVIDDHEIIQMIPLDEVAWHAGDSNGPGNMRSIAAEHCINSDGDFDAVLRSGEWLWAEIQRNPSRFAWNGTPPKTVKLEIVQHNHWSGKDCPHVIRTTGAWPDYLSAVTRNLGSSSAPDASPVVPFAYARPIAPPVIKVGAISGLKRVITVGPAPANRRVAPALNADLTGPPIDAGKTFVAIGLVSGETVDGTANWWLGSSGSYVSCATTVDKP